MILNILIFIGTFIFMEFMAWFTHKYIMHGFMWYFHRDHHVHEPGFFERNDVFFLIFAVPSFLCIFTGLKAGGDFRVWIGAGIALYGLCYFLVHDVFIHQRFKWLRNSSNPYLLSLRRAHKIHHKHLGPQDGECFGMLVVPYKYWKESKRMVERQKTT